MMHRNLIAYFMLCSVLLLLINAAGAGEVLLTLTPSMLHPGSALVIDCDTTWNNTDLFLYFAPTDASQGEEQIGNSRFSLRLDPGSRYVWSPIGSTGMRCRIEQALSTDAGTYRCQDKLLEKEAIKRIPLDTPETILPTITTKLNDECVTALKAEHNSSDALMVIIACVVTAVCLLIAISILAVTLVCKRKCRADKEEKGSKEEFLYQKNVKFKAYDGFPPAYESLTAYEEPNDSKGISNRGLLDKPPIYADCYPSAETNAYAECVPRDEANIYAECVPVELQDQMSSCTNVKCQVA